MGQEGSIPTRASIVFLTPLSADSRQEIFAASKARNRSRDRPAGDHSQPYRDEPDNDTEDYIQSGHEQFSVLDAAKGSGLDFAGRGGAAVKSDGNQIAPVRPRGSSLGENGNDEPDEE